MVGTPSYIAPEVLTRGEYERERVTMMIMIGMIKTIKRQSRARSMVTQRTVFKSKQHPNITYEQCLRTFRDNTKMHSLTLRTEVIY